jgi:hypothetical protein
MIIAIKLLDSYGKTEKFSNIFYNPEDAIKFINEKCISDEKMEVRIFSDKLEAIDYIKKKCGLDGHKLQLEGE